MGASTFLAIVKIQASYLIALHETAFICVWRHLPSNHIE